jgi:hypothetical protein
MVWGSIACSREVSGPDSTTSVETVPDSAAATSAGGQVVTANTVPATPMPPRSSR